MSKLDKPVSSDYSTGHGSSDDSSGYANGHGCGQGRAIGDMQPFCGRRLFELRATHGLPLEMSVDKIFSNGISIDWIGYIDAARGNNWLDYRIIRDIEFGLIDADVPRETRDAILVRARMYMIRGRNHHEQTR